MAEVEKKSIVVAVDDSEQSVYALEWTLDHLITSFHGNSPFKLFLVHARPIATSVLHIVGPGAAEVLPLVEIDLKKIGARVLEQAKALCQSRSVYDFEAEMVEGDARNVLCDAAERHAAEILVVGSHGYGAIKRPVLGSVSDYCAHHAKCTVMIVKKPKH
uniref:TSA: Wollemia nobilis Ref_Wollemi_Transcript_14145_570 transcribed RNA sequence n=1 Tax=Wollemia nobilis TaxID=56998 RepID=A0A0C9RJW2_9CONI